MTLPLKGTAGGDLRTEMAADWYYLYDGKPGASGSNDPDKLESPLSTPEQLGYIPMLWTGVVADGKGHANGNIPSNYAGYFIMFAEPDGPVGPDVTPAEAVPLLEAVVTEWPSAKIVFGNNMTETGTASPATGEYWVDDALTAIGNDQDVDYPDYWAFTVYAWSLDDVDTKMGLIDNMIAAIDTARGDSACRIWITESGCPLGKLDVANKLWQALAGHDRIDRVAAFPGYKLDPNDDDALVSNFPMGTKVQDHDEMWVYDDEYCNNVNYWTSWFSVNDRVCFFGFANAQNDGFAYVEGFGSSNQWMSVKRLGVTKELVNETNPSAIAVYKGCWNPEMIIWDKTADAITPMGTLFKHSMENEMIFIDGELQWNGITINYSSGWNTQDLDNWTTEVPAGAKGIIVRVSGMNSDLDNANYLGFSGDAGATKQLHGLIRDKNHNDQSIDEQFIIPLDDNKFYYRVNKVDAQFTYVYLVVFGYVY
jgi:hypothetical protein